jgi:hypothetical protein
VYQYTSCFEIWMDKTCLELLVKDYYDALDFANLSFDNIVHCYDSVISHLFSDNIYNTGRYIVADFFALYIARRTANVNKYELLRALREKLEEKWHSSSTILNRG